MGGLGWRGRGLGGGGGGRGMGEEGGGGGGGRGNRQPSLTFQSPVTLDKGRNYKSKREFGKSYY
jgi:hypothetical protein